MKGRQVRVIWMQFEDENGKLSKQRLILSTLSSLMPQQIFVYYARRWSIEDLFNQMKNRWGWKDSWQQSRLVLHRWTKILSIAYSLPQILVTYCGEQVQDLIHITPWRKKNPVTAGCVRLGLQMILGNVRIREWWRPKCRIFKPPKSHDPPIGGQYTAKNQYGFMSKNNVADFHPPPS